MRQRLRLFRGKNMINNIFYPIICYKNGRYLLVPLFPAEAIVIPAKGNSEYCMRSRNNERAVTHIQRISNTTY